MRRAISLSIVVTGFTAMASQIVYLRELLVVFYGNELSIAYVLASWLAAGAIGAWALGRFSDRINPVRDKRFSVVSNGMKSKTAVFAACQAVAAVMLPLGVYAIRFIRPALGINAGEIFPLFPMVLSSFVIFAPLCMLLGFMFTLACRISDDIGKPYVLESAGAIIGGLAASFFLMPLLDPFRAVWLIGLINLAASIILAFSIGKKRPKLLVAAVLLLMISGIIGLFLKWPEEADRRSVAGSWRGYELVDSKNSIYGNVAVLKREGQISFFDNGLRLFTIPDKQSCEEAVHFALLEHPNPKDVLLIGGGAAGLAAEILKHPVSRLDYVELDPLIIEMAGRHSPAEYKIALEDPRVSIKSVDGRFFVKNAGRKYDCIIISLGDPHTAQINRYYTVEFYRQAGRILNEGGVLCFGVTASASYINRDAADFLGSIYLTLKKVFADVKAVPGETAYMLASNKTGVLTYDYKILMSRADRRNIDLQYVREYYLYSKMAPDKIRYFDNTMIMGSENVKPNYDLKPISYYYDMVCWSGRFKDSAVSRILRAAKNSALWAWLSAFYVFVMAIMFFVVIRARRRMVPAVLFSVGTMGFGIMALQIVILLAFQAIYGYLFYKLGLILTSFMAGLALGGFIAIKTRHGLKSDHTAFMRAHAAITLYPLLLPALFWRPSGILFIMAPALLGLIGGFQFPIAGRICTSGTQRFGKLSGYTYGSDLAGSCMGALLTGSLLIPVLGIPATCVIISVVNAAALALLLMGGMKYEP